MRIALLILATACAFGQAPPVLRKSSDVSGVQYVAGGGTAQAQTATLSPAITAQADGQRVCWLPIAANTAAAPTLAVNGLTATTITKLGTTALVADDLTTTAVACAILVGANYQLQNPQTVPAGSGDVLGASNLTTLGRNAYVSAASTVTEDPMFARTGIGKYLMHDTTATTGETELVLQNGPGQSIAPLNIKNNAGTSIASMSAAGGMNLSAPFIGASISGTTITGTGFIQLGSSSTLRFGALRSHISSTADGNIHFSSNNDITDASLTGIAALTASGLATTATLSTGAMKASTVNACPSATGTDDYTCTISPAWTEYTLNGCLVLNADTANTLTATLDVNGLGVKSILNRAVGALATGDITANAPITLCYDGTQFIVQGDGGGGGGGLGDPGANGLVQRTALNTTSAIADSSTVGQTLRVTGASTYAWGALDLADTDAVTGVLPAGNHPSASTTATGIVELAIDTEVTTGTSATLAITPDALAGSTIFGTKVVQVEIYPVGTAATTGDGKTYFYVPPALNGMDLVGVRAQVYTAGTTGTLNIDIARCVAAATGNVCSSTVADMLTTNMTIDTGENATDTAAAAAVIDTANDDVATGQVLRFDIDAIHTTPSLGLLVILTFQLP